MNRQDEMLFDLLRQLSRETHRNSPKYPMGWREENDRMGGPQCRRGGPDSAKGRMPKPDGKPFDGMPRGPKPDGMPFEGMQRGPKPMPFGGMPSHPENMPFDGAKRGPKNMPFRQGGFDRPTFEHRPFENRGPVPNGVYGGKSGKIGRRMPPRPMPENPPFKPEKKHLGRERVLTVISKYPDGVRQSVIADELHISPSSMSELINKLESDGYVKRTVDTEDRRATLISLTELGIARAAEVSDEREKFVSGMFSKLTEDEKSTLIALLTKLFSREDAPNQPENPAEI